MKRKILFIIMFIESSIIVGFLTFIIVSLIKNIIQNHDISSINASDKIIYVESSGIYYNNKIYEIDKRIVWIGNNSYIYLKDNDFYLVNESNESLIYENVSSSINLRSIIYDDYSLYYKMTNKYYKCDTLSSTINVCDENIYNKIKNGNVYNIEIIIDKQISFNIMNTNNNEKRIITTDSLKKNNRFNSYCEAYEIRYSNYEIIGNNLYIHFLFGNYGLTVNYNIEKDNIEDVYNFYKENRLELYNAFYLDDFVNHPLMKSLTI